MSQDVTDRTAAETASVRASKRWIAAGTVVVLGSLALYVTSLSRTTGMIIAPIGFGYLAVGIWCSRTGRRAPRWVFVVMATLTGLAIVLGAITYIYSNLITHPQLA